MRTAPLAPALFATALLACTGGRSEPRDDATVCVEGTVRFVLRAQPTDPGRWCIGADCMRAWLTIVDPHGVEHPVDRPCLPSCDTCAPYGCPASCAAPTPIDPSGVERVWDGRYFVNGTCGGGACTSSTCASAGRFIARMCAHRDVGDDPSRPICTLAPEPTCTDVAFDWPPAAGTTVTGFVGAAACCDGG